MAARYGSRDLTDPKFDRDDEMLVENQIQQRIEEKIHACV